MNYVFFFTDEMRADMLSCYGNEWVNTPNFDKLASEGVLFEECHVQNTLCSPSRCCLALGQYIHNHGHRTLTNLIKPHEKNLFGYLRNNGYDVRIYGKNDLFSQEGAEVFTDEFTREKGSPCTKTKPISNYGEDGFYSMLHTPMGGTIEDTSDYKEVAKALDFMNNWKQGDKPFIIFLPIIFPHCPYTAPEPYYSMYFDKMHEFKFRGYGENKPEYQSLIRKYRDLQNYDMKKLLAVYGGMVTMCDDLMGMLMDCVQENGLSDDTIIITTSDHGDYAGDYGLIEKWSSSLDDVLTRVPLIIKSPNCKQNHRVKELVEMFDIMPTILETAKIEVGHRIFAKSLVPQLNGEDGYVDRFIFAEGGIDPEDEIDSDGVRVSKNVVNASGEKIDVLNHYYPKRIQQSERPDTNDRSVMIRNLKYKLVKRTYHQDELYDMKNDHNEMINLYGKEEYKEVQNELERKLLDWYIKTSDTTPFKLDSRRAEKKLVREETL